MKRQFIYIILVVLLIIVWEFFGNQYNNVRLLVSTPSNIVNYFVVEHSALLQATSVTFIEAVLGLLFATIISFSIMIICFYFPKFMEFIMPIMVTSQVIPLIVLAPFFILLFGIGLISKVVMATLIAFFPIFVNFATGVKAIPKELMEFAQINNTPTHKKITNIYFPLSLPNIFAGLKVATTLSVIGAIVAEFTGAKIGLGKNLFLSAKRLEPELMMSSLILSIIVGGFLFLSILILERKTTKWIGKVK